MGGHSYSSHHHHHYGGSRISYSSGGDSCCNGKVILISIFIFFVILYVVIAAATYPKGSNKETALSLSETRTVGVSSTWYSKVSATRPSFKDITLNTSYTQSSDPAEDVRLMRFKSKPPLTASSAWVLQETSLVIPDYDHYYWSWYLYSGSTINIAWSFDMAVTMYLIRGTKGYDSYYDDDGYTSSHTVQKIRNSQGNRTFTILKDDIFFVIFENWDIPYIAKGNGTFAINSLLYNTSNPDASCSLPCEMDVPYGTDVYILYTPLVSDYLALGGSPNSEFTFRFRKHSRAWFVGVVLFTIPLVVMFVVMGIIVLIIKRKDIAKSLHSVPSTPSISSSPSTPMTTFVATTPVSPTPYPVVTPYPAPAPYPQPVVVVHPHPDLYPLPQFATPAGDYPPSEAPPPASAPAPAPAPYSQPPSQPTMYEQGPPPYMYPPSTAYTPNAYPPPVNPEYQSTYPPS